MARRFAGQGGEAGGREPARESRMAPRSRLVRPRFRRRGQPEPERFSLDLDWMPRLVLVAKSTYVWLDQLSKAYGRDIQPARPDPRRGARPPRAARLHRPVADRALGAQPGVAADQAAARQSRGGRVGLLARRLPDRRRPRRRGRVRGPQGARVGARASGSRSDMVPNHMGIDSRWVVEHPDWFISLAEPPYPAYSFTGPDLSPDGRVALRIEDHYFDNTDAAVVFQRVDTATGDTRYVYHGNDGTRMPWNDTAQLDYLRADVREAVIQTILARRAALAGHPLRRRDDARQAPHRAALVPGAGPRGRHPVARRARDDQGAVRGRDAGRVLARGGRPRRRRGARHAAARRGVLADGGLLRPDARHAPRLQQRVHEHAPRRAERAVPRGDQEHARVRSRGAQALRQLHEQPRREDRGRAVRQGRQVLRRRDADGDDARAADVRARPDRGLHREVRHGVPARLLGRAPGPVARRAPRARDLAAAASAARSSPHVDEFLLYDFVADDGSVDEDVFAYSNRRGGDALAGRLPQPVRVDVGPDPRVGALCRASRGGRGRPEAIATEDAGRRARPLRRRRAVRDPARPPGRARVPARDARARDRRSAPGPGRLRLPSVPRPRRGGRFAGTAVRAPRGRARRARSAERRGIDARDPAATGPGADRTAARACVHGVVAGDGRATCARRRGRAPALGPGGARRGPARRGIGRRRRRWPGCRCIGEGRGAPRGRDPAHRPGGHRGRRRSRRARRPSRPGLAAAGPGQVDRGQQHGERPGRPGLDRCLGPQCGHRRGVPVCRPGRGRFVAGRGPGEGASGRSRWDAGAGRGRDRRSLAQRRHGGARNRGERASRGPLVQSRGVGAGGALVVARGTGGWRAARRGPCDGDPVAGGGDRVGLPAR